MYLGLYAAELVCMFFQEHDPHPDVFDALANLLKELPDARAEEFFLAFELDLLAKAGYAPQLGDCVNCGADIAARESVWFAPSRGGVVCRDCESTLSERMALDGRLLRLLQSVSAARSRNLPRLTRHQTDPLNRILAGHVTHILGRPLRMAGYVLAAGRGGLLPIPGKSRPVSGRLGAPTRAGPVRG
jgi:DNA repair protein RecO (recombination protein O)